MYPQLNDPEWLRREYLERNRTGRELADEIGCHPNTLAEAFQRHGIRKPRRQVPALIDKEWLHEQHVEQGRSARQMADELGVAPRSVQRALAAAQIPAADRRLPDELDDRGWLITHDYLSRAEIARMLGVSREAVGRARRRHGLRGGAASPFWQLDDPAWLHEQYHGRGWTQQRVADEIGCARSAVTQAMQRLGIRARPQQQGRFPKLNDAAWLAEQVRAGRSTVQIAVELGCHRTSVGDALRKHHLR